jgi:hypothetical protein
MINEVVAPSSEGRPICGARIGRNVKIQKRSDQHARRFGILYIANPRISDEAYISLNKLSKRDRTVDFFVRHGL